MTTSNTFAGKTALAAAALFTLGLLGAQPAAAQGGGRFVDSWGQDRGYAWCLQRTSNRWDSGTNDCSYQTLAQCRAASPTPVAGACQPNPHAAAAAPRGLR
jgi:hypothetical protein